MKPSHLCAFQFPTISNTNMAVVRTCDIGGTAAPLHVGV